jgi:antirestriction protein ArdC
MSTLSPSQKGETFTVPRLDIHDLVTSTIIEQLEKGTVPWQKPWNGPNHKPLGLPENYITGNKYQGINIVLLWCSAIKHNYHSSEWGSFKQWQTKKEAIRKGEKGNLVVYYDTIEKEKDGEIQKIPFLKSSYVFNRCQLASFEPPAETEEPIDTFSLIEKIDAVEQFVSNTKAIIEQQGDRAFYSTATDKITMPYPEYFENTATCTATEGYYSTLLHELSHWTGHKERLNRLEKAKFGDKRYANEELVAEFSSAFLCAGFGIATLDKGNHASYIQSWLKALKEDNRCIFKAASEASKVYSYLHKLTSEN